MIAQRRLLKHTATSIFYSSAAPHPTAPAPHSHQSRRAVPSSHQLCSLPPSGTRIHRRATAVHHCAAPCHGSNPFKRRLKCRTIESTCIASTTICLRTRAAHNYHHRTAHGSERTATIVIVPPLTQSSPDDHRKRFYGPPLQYLQMAVWES